MERLRNGVLVAVLLAFAGCGGNSLGPTPPSPPSLVYQAGDAGVSLPTAVTRVNPTYTQEALQAGIQGAVLVSLVVLADGTVGDVTVLRSLDTTFGLDGQAVSAARQWIFTPGMKDGRSVAVRVTIEFTFTFR